MKCSAAFVTACSLANLACCSVRAVVLVAVASTSETLLIGEGKPVVTGTA